jgi:hypothetical protein
MEEMTVEWRIHWNIVGIIWSIRPTKMIMRLQGASQG